MVVVKGLFILSLMQQQKKAAGFLAVSSFKGSCPGSSATNSPPIFRLEIGPIVERYSFTYVTDLYFKNFLSVFRQTALYL